MIKKIIGFSMMDSAVFLFLASYGYIKGRSAPLLHVLCCAPGAQALKHVTAAPGVLPLPIRGARRPLQRNAPGAMG